MKKLLAAATILSIFALVSISTAAETVEKDKGYISVNASTIKEVAPNQAEITVGIETSDTSLQKASESNKIIANQVYTSIKALLGSGDYVKTNTYRATPIYIYTKENKKVFDKYVVSNTITVKTKNTEIVSKLIDTAVSKGATNVENLQFSATDYDNACNEALADLTKKAYNQANTVAKSINSQISGVKSINANCTADSGPRPYYEMMAKSTMNAVDSTPIETGKQKINVNVDASFYVN